MEPQFWFMEGSDGNLIQTNWFGFQGVSVGRGELDTASRVATAMRQNDPDLVPEAELPIYEKAMAYQRDGDIEQYGHWGKFGPKSGSTLALEILHEDQYTANAYFGPNTETMNRKFGNLKGKMNEIYTRVIMGAPIEEFDTWVEYWNDQGGAEITQEVNAWYEENK
jgi:putative aldouronate transport system substrate-binding protein